jgi:hypothetical protein
MIIPRSIFIGEGLKPGGRDIRRWMGQHPAITEHEKAIAAIQPRAEFFSQLRINGRSLAKQL